MKVIHKPRLYFACKVLINVTPWKKNPPVFEMLQWSITPKLGFLNVSGELAQLKWTLRRAGRIRGRSANPPGWPAVSGPDCRPAGSNLTGTEQLKHQQTKEMCCCRRRKRKRRRSSTHHPQAGWVWLLYSGPLRGPPPASAPAAEAPPARLNTKQHSQAFLWDD